MTHIQGIAQKHQPWYLVRRGRQERIRHGAKRAAFQRLEKRRTDTLRQRREDYVAQVTLDAAVLDRRTRQVLRDIDEDTGFAGPDLVHENGRLVAIQQDMAISRLWQLSIDQLQTPEPRAHLRCMRVVLFAKLGVIPIRDDGEMAKVAIAQLVPGDAVDAHHLVRIRAGDEIRALGLNNRDIGTLLCRLTKLHHESPMVKRAALWHFRRRGLSRVRDFHRVSEICDVVALDGDRIDILQTVAQAQFVQRVHASRLQELADDAVRFFHGCFEEEHAAALSTQRDGECAAKNSRADNYHVGFMVETSALFR